MNVSKEVKIYLRLASTFVGGTALGFLIAYFSGINPSIIPIISALIGLGVAFAIPIWQAYFLNVPKLSVEVSAITRAVSDSALLSLDDYPELTVLKPSDKPILIFNTFDDMGLEELGHSAKGPVKGKTISDLEQLLIRAKQQLRELPEAVEKRRKELDNAKTIRPSEFTKYDADLLNRPLRREVEFDVDNKDATLTALVKSYEERLQQSEKRYAELQTGLPLAERKLEQLRAELIGNRSYFTVSLSLINSGRTNTAIKVPALLRIFIGEGHYVDIKMALKDFENKSEISASGTRIVLFESSEVSSFPEDDRKLINTYWGQSVSAKIFLEDIHSTTYSSNAIAFAEGLYQKIIYDRLARAAGSHIA